MVLKLYARTGWGGGGGIVALTLAEKQIPFEHAAINLAQKEHKTPEFLAMHPFGQVPVIVRAFPQFHRNMRSKALPLLPTGLKERALVEQAASVEFANFLPAVLNVVTEFVRKPLSGMPTDDAASATALAELSTVLDVYETILSKHRYFGGDEFTIADLFHFSYAPMLADAGVPIMTSTGPNVARWWNDLISRPAWIKLKEEGIKGTAI
ncbi:Glutathione S-transferase [Mycena venus]|uniref:glutathione transferase n=1 Tax=Mycena venus TaxID=2733690 RepID=A0A8H7CSZ9_9AGAR|nr:Glutathione S-transferase [Mycena venus]